MDDLEITATSPAEMNGHEVDLGRASVGGGGGGASHLSGPGAGVGLDDSKRSSLTPMMGPSSIVEKSFADDAEDRRRSVSPVISLRGIDGMDGVPPSSDATLFNPSHSRGSVDPHRDFGSSLNGPRPTSFERVGSAAFERGSGSVNLPPYSFERNISMTPGPLGFDHRERDILGIEHRPERRALSDVDHRRLPDLPIRTGLRLPDTPRDHMHLREERLRLPDSKFVLTENRISDTRFANRKRALNRLIAKIRSLGAELDASLPGIVVIGNQSAGKSSLIEAISGVHVPRDTGSCTHCPIEVRLQQKDDRWTCRVRLRIMYDSRGRVLQPVRELPFGPPLHDPRHVEDRLRRAQYAILSGWDDPLRLLNVTELPTLHRTVSPNVVCVEVSGRDVCDLAFIDLPGLINNADDESIRITESLVRHHIRRNNIILLFLPMTEDRETQKAALMAREVDPHGERTIGVLTKPDMREHGADSRLLAAFRGERDVLKRGVYVVRQPDTHERSRGISFVEARRQEDAFFSGPEWRNLPPHLRRRLGTRALVDALSHLLCVHIDRLRRPLEETITIKHRDVLRRLEGLPRPVIVTDVGYGVNPSVELVQLCNSLHRELDANVQGILDHRRLWHAARGLYAALARKVDAARPVFHPWPTAASHAETCHAVTLSIRVGSLHTSTGTHTMHLEDVRRFIENATTKELPYSVPYAAKEQLQRWPLVKWKELTSETIDAAKALFITLVRDEVDRIFGRFSHTTLKAEVNSIALHEIDVFHRRAHDFCARVLRLESTPLTLHGHDVGKLRHQALEELRALRRHRLTEGTLDTWSAIEDSWEQEILAMADAVAYHSIASKRITDSVCMAIHAELFEPLPNRILASLLERLKIHDHVHVSRLLGTTSHVGGHGGTGEERDPKIERLRVELEEQAERLVKVKEEFARFHLED